MSDMILKELFPFEDRLWLITPEEAQQTWWVRMPYLVLQAVGKPYQYLYVAPRFQDSYFPLPLNWDTIRVHRRHDYPRTFEEFLAHRKQLKKEQPELFRDEKERWS